MTTGRTSLRRIERNTRTSLVLLGAFAVEHDGRLLDLPPSAQRVLAFVALQPGPVQRGYVAGSLWPDSTEERAQANLRSTLWRLGREGGGLVEGTRALLRLGGGVDVDVREAERLARSSLADAAPDRALVSALTSSGDLLPDWYDEWVTLERERYRQLRLRALDMLCETLAAAGRFGEAFDAGMAAIAADPLRESAHRAVVRLHLAEGNAGAAMRQYELCRRLLNEQLGLEPTRLMTDLVATRPTDGVAVVRVGSRRSRSPARAGALHR